MLKGFITRDPVMAARVMTAASVFWWLLGGVWWYFVGWEAGAAWWLGGLSIPDLRKVERLP